jgi:hypothetical protein
MTARLEVLERRTLLSGIFPDGRHAIHLGGTVAADMARVWIDTRKTRSRGEDPVIARSTRDTIFGGMGNVRIGGVVGNNPLYGLITVGLTGTGTPAGYTYSVDGTEHVVDRGSDAHIHELSYSPSSGWHQVDLTATTGAPAAAGDPAGYTYSVDGTQHVVYRGVDGHIHELWYSPSSGWHHADLTAATG